MIIYLISSQIVLNNIWINVVLMSEMYVFHAQPNWLCSSHIIFIYQNIFWFPFTFALTAKHLNIFFIKLVVLRYSVSISDKWCDFPKLRLSAEDSLRLTASFIFESIVDSKLRILFLLRYVFRGKQKRQIIAQKNRIKFKFTVKTRE